MQNKILSDVEVLRYRELSGIINELSNAILGLQNANTDLDEKNQQLQKALDKFTEVDKLQEE